MGYTVETTGRPDSWWVRSPRKNNVEDFRRVKEDLGSRTKAFPKDRADYIPVTRCSVFGVGVPTAANCFHSSIHKIGKTGLVGGAPPRLYPNEQFRSMERVKLFGSCVFPMYCCSASFSWKACLQWIIDRWWRPTMDSRKKRTSVSTSRSWEPTGTPYLWVLDARVI